MEISKNLKRGLIVPYSDTVDDEQDIFERINNGWTLTNIEDFEQEESGYLWAKYEVDRLLDFVAMAYCEIKYCGRLTERFKGEMELDIPVWDSGEVDKFLDEDEKKLIYEHLAIIKKYLKENEASE